jgi:hypothetical protein
MLEGGIRIEYFVVGHPTQYYEVTGYSSECFISNFLCKHKRLIFFSILSTRKNVSVKIDGESGLGVLA